MRVLTRMTEVASCMRIENKELADFVARHDVHTVFDGRDRYVYQADVLAAVSAELQATRHATEQTETHNAEGVLTVDAAADWLSISVSKLYQLIAANQIATITIGRSRRVPVEALRVFIANRRAR